MTVPVTAQDGPAEASPRGALSRLIQDALDSGLSYSQLARRSVDRGSGATVSKQYLQKIVKTPPVNPPSAAQLKAIAAGTGRPERIVKEAAAEQWLEYEATELAGYGEEVRIIVGHLAGKSKAEQRRWLAMIEADERSRRED